MNQFASIIAGILCRRSFAPEQRDAINQLHWESVVARLTDLAPHFHNR